MVGLTGRPAKPAALKVLEGNKTRRPIPPEPAYKPGKCKPPGWLTERAQEKYKALHKIMEPLGVFTEADEHALAMCAAAFDDFLSACDAVAAHGRVYETVTQTGSIIYRPRPEVAQMQDAWRRHVAALSQFGLTPATRSRVGGGSGDKAKDPFADYLAERAQSRKG